jgi:hypothetical protein
LVGSLIVEYALLLPSLCPAGQNVINRPRRRILDDFYPAPGMAEIADGIYGIVTTIVDEAR